MPVRATGSNPRLIQWARKTAGLTLQELAERLHRSVEEVQGWEEGQSLPTFSQLERLASIVRRPVAVFFFPDPPEEEDFQHEFRTIPRAEFEKLHPDTRLALREARAYQISLEELSRGTPREDRLITREIDASRVASGDELAVMVREYLGVSVEQQHSWRGSVEAFKAWREIVQSAGVHVFKRPFDQSTISGFSLHDERFPLIMINNGTAFTRQTFTLFHELAHLLFHVSGVTPTDVHFEDRLAGRERDLEVTCNRFAAEFLLPNAAFPWELFDRVEVISGVESTASAFNVSREVVLRRLRDAGRVDQETYEVLAERWIGEAEAARRSSASGGNYYANQATYLGDSFVNLGFDQLRAGRISAAELAEHFRMKASTLARFEQYLLERQAS